MKPQSSHRPQKVISVDCFPLLLLALIAGLASDEADELGNALLNGVLGVLGDLAVGGKDLLHDAADVGDGKVAVLLTDVGLGALLADALMAASSGTRWSIGHRRRETCREQGGLYLARHEEGERIGGGVILRREKERSNDGGERGEGR